MKFILTHNSFLWDDVILLVLGCKIKKIIKQTKTKNNVMFICLLLVLNSRSFKTFHKVNVHFKIHRLACYHKYTSSEPSIAHFNKLQPCFSYCTTFIPTIFGYSRQRVHVFTALKTSLEESVEEIKKKWVEMTFPCGGNI